MLYDVDEVQIGQTVYLDAHSKGAPAICHRRLVVKVMHPPARFWPYLVVEWKEDGVDKWARVHRDNIKKRPVQDRTVAERKEGDTGSGTTSQKWQRRLALPKPVALIEDQMELF